MIYQPYADDTRYIKTREMSSEESGSPYHSIYA